MHHLNLPEMRELQSQYIHVHIIIANTIASSPSCFFLPIIEHDGEGEKTLPVQDVSILDALILLSP